MKTFPLNKAPYSAALYLRKCEEKKNSAACRRIDFFERAYRSACLAVAAVASVTCLVAVLEIAFILTK